MFIAIFIIEHVGTIPSQVHQQHLIPCFYIQGTITNILEENVVQPLLVSTSAVTLATETVRSILKIDDIVSVLGYGDGGVSLARMSARGH